jgi:hypothetical protein
MFKEPRGIASQHTTNYEAVMHCPAHTRREVSLSSDKDASSNVTAYIAHIKGSNEQHKDRPPGTTTMTSRGDDHG